MMPTFGLAFGFGVTMRRLRKCELVNRQTLACCYCGMTCYSGLAMDVVSSQSARAIAVGSIPDLLHHAASSP